MIAYLFATACLAFVAQLPIARTSLGHGLRRMALVCFLLALAPSVFLGAAREVAGRGRSPQIPGCASLLVAGLILSGLAYAALALRRRFGRPRRDAWADFVNLRSTGKVLPRTPQRGLFDEEGP